MLWIPLTGQCCSGGISSANVAISTAGNIIIMAIKSCVDTGISNFDTTGAGICTDSNSVYFPCETAMLIMCIVGSLDAWLQNVGSLWTHYERARYYDYLGQYTVADSIFSRIGGLLTTIDSIEVVATAPIRMCGM